MNYDYLTQLNLYKKAQEILSRPDKKDNKELSTMKNKFDVTLNFVQDSLHNNLPSDVQESNQQVIIDKMIKSLSEEKDASEFKDIVQDDLACTFQVRGENDTLDIYFNCNGAVNLEELIENLGDSERLTEITGLSFEDSWLYLQDLMMDSSLNGKGEQFHNNLVAKYTEWVIETLKEKESFELLRILEK